MTYSVEELAIPNTLDCPEADDFRAAIAVRNAAASHVLGPAAGTFGPEEVLPGVLDQQHDRKRIFAVRQDGEIVGTSIVVWSVDPDTRVTLNRDGNIVLSYAPNNEEGHKRLIAKLKDLLGHLECRETLIPRNLFVEQRIPLAGVTHQCRTLRFGRDPEASVLDVNVRTFIAHTFARKLIWCGGIG